LLATWAEGGIPDFDPPRVAQVAGNLGLEEASMKRTGVSGSMLLEKRH
jgi:hypothetical protein